MRGQGDGAWLWATVLSLLFLIVGEIYSAYDPNWLFWPWASVFISLQYLEVATSFVIYRGVGDVSGRTDLSLLVSHYVNGLASLVGFKTSFIAAFILGECNRLDDHTIDRAKACIDTYASYASLDGPWGLTNACASLDVSVQSYIGGTCPNVSHPHGTALLIVQMIFVMLMTLFNVGKFTVTYSGLTESPQESEAPLYTPNATKSSAQRAAKPTAQHQTVRRPLVFINGNRR